MSPQLAFFLCGVIVIAAIAAVFVMAEVSTFLRERPRGKHARPFADPADAADPDGEQFIAELHHEPPGPVLRFDGSLNAERLARIRDAYEAARHRPPLMLPAPPPADTRPQPVIKDVAACELGMPTEEYIDGLFAKYAQVTR